MKKTVVWLSLICMTGAWVINAAPPTVNEEKMQDRKCTYHVFFYLLKSGIKRGLNDLVFFLPEQAPEFINALQKEVGDAQDAPDLDRLETVLADQFDTMPALDAMSEDYAAWKEKVACCAQHNC